MSIRYFDSSVSRWPIYLREHKVNRRLNREQGDTYIDANELMFIHHVEVRSAVADKISFMFDRE